MASTRRNHDDVNLSSDSTVSAMRVYHAPATGRLISSKYDCDGEAAVCDLEVKNSRDQRNSSLNDAHDCTSVSLFLAV